MKLVYIVSLVLLFSFIENTFGQEKKALVYASSFEKAQEKALQEDKEVLLVFSGSDWCKACIILDRTILQDSLFIDFANENLVVYKADFPRKKKNRLSKDIAEYNDLLASKYNKRGEFPTVLLFSKDAELKSVLVYNHLNANEFINQIKKY